MGCSHFCKKILFAMLLIQDSRQKVASTLNWWCTVFWWKQMAVSWKVALSELRMRTYLLTWRLAYCWKLERSAKMHQNCHVVVLYAIHSCWYGIRVLLASIRLGVGWGGGGGGCITSPQDCPGNIGANFDRLQCNGQSAFHNMQVTTVGVCLKYLKQRFHSLQLFWRGYYYWWSFVP